MERCKEFRRNCRSITGEGIEMGEVEKGGEIEGGERSVRGEGDSWGRREGGGSHYFFCDC